MDDLISREAVEEIINDIRSCISVEGYWAILERMKKLPPVKPQERTGHWEWQTNSDLETTLCLLPKIQSEDGQDYVQLADVLETVRRYKPSVDKPQERSE